MLGTQPAEGFIITYHLTQEDADSGENALESPYTVVDQVTLFTRVEVDDSDPFTVCLLYTSPSPRDATLSRMPSSA